MLAKFLRWFHNPAILCILVKFYCSCQEIVFFKLIEVTLEIVKCLIYYLYHLIALTLIKKLGSVDSVSQTNTFKDNILPLSF